ncbi:hypothetical protein HDV05_007028 [Chytridiales sp. JEL 0842]|nr:hypothetical protein HDV05_007028 [Chytridiales sp. JEL 0842]
MGPGFFRLLGSFYAGGLLDVGTQMSFARLSNGKFLVLSTIELSPAMKAEVDKLTDNGNLIEAVIGTHPFHTLAFRDFYKMYPNAPFYGTPRHLRRIKDIPWAGDLNEAEVRDKWSPEVEMRIPAGAEFVDPQPESYNHFSGVFVFHKESRTLYCDDTIAVSNNPNFVSRLFGAKEGSMFFHPGIYGPGLYSTEEAPKQFLCWLDKLINDWDFVNIATAHNGYLLGTAKEKLTRVLKRQEPKLLEMSKKKAKDPKAWTPDWKSSL